MGEKKFHAEPMVHLSRCKRLEAYKKTETLKTPLA